MGRFAGKVLFATGGASGIGAATARRFAAEGGRVAVADLDRDRAAEVASALEGSLAVACDVADERSVVAAVEATHEQFGRIDCVLNSAGFVKFTPLEELSLEEWNRLLAVHLTGTFLVCRAALPVLRESGGGSIVNVASVAALLARPHLAAYAAAKGGIIAFSRQLALDAAADGVRVNVLARASRRRCSRASTATTRSASIQARMAEPEEIAATACFLLSDDASFFTGALLVPDGGATAL
jgi:3-oxoacyl-[acyl-carrier protein] reductase